MANKLAVVKYTPPGILDTVELADTISGNYVAGGDTLNLNPSTFTDPNGVGIVGYPDAVPSRAVRVVVNNADGYYAQVVPGTTLAGFKLQWFTSEGNELAAGAYPAGITGAQVHIYVPV